MHGYKFLTTICFSSVRREARETTSEDHGIHTLLVNYFKLSFFVRKR